MAKNKNKASHPSSEEESAVAEETKEETSEQPSAEEIEGAGAEEVASAEEAAESSETSGDEGAEASGEDEAAAESSDDEDAAEESEEEASDEDADEDEEATEEEAAEEPEHVEEPVAVAVVQVVTTTVEETIVVVTSADEEVEGYLAYFDYPDELLHAADETHKAGYKDFDAYSPFPIHGMDDALGLGRSWLPWVTFGAGATGFSLANAMQFGMLAFDWPMIIGGKPYAPWPSFVPIMFELTVLIGGVTTALVMLIAARCFRRNRIMDPGFTDDRFALWISAKDAQFGGVLEFMESLHPVEIRPVHRETT
jgi:hypothetical protein